MNIDEFLSRVTDDPDGRIKQAIKRLHDWPPGGVTFRDEKKQPIFWITVRLRSGLIEPMFRVFPNQGTYVMLKNLAETDREGLRRELAALDPDFPNTEKEPTFDVRTIASDEGWARFTACVAAMA